MTKIGVCCGSFLWPALAALICLSPGLTVISAVETSEEIRFHGIRATDPEGLVGLRNPERGFRIGTVFAEPEGSPFPDGHTLDTRGPAHLQGKVPAAYSDQGWLLDAKRYEPYGLTLAQTYCYLDQYLDGPIADEKLQALQRSFDHLRQAGLKDVLRFAYEGGRKGMASGPTLEIILRHISQLAPVIRRNADVIYVMQAGFVGAWGEWHDSAHKLEEDHANLAALVAKVLAVLPAERMIQVRVPKYKRWVLSEPSINAFRVVDAATAFTATPAARIGFDNDGFLADKTDGGTWPEPPFFSNPGNPEFDYMTAESPYVAVDGELFWSDQRTTVDGYQAAIRMRLHHYSSFSLAHSYSGQEGQLGSIDKWIKTPLTIDQLRKAKLPVSDGYFENSAGNPVERTQFEYIRDHLGYRLELQQARFPTSVRRGDVFAVEASLINRGFSTLCNPRRAYFVLINLAGQVAGVYPADTDPHGWQPFKPGDDQFWPLIHEITARLPVAPELAPGPYMLGLWLPDAAESLRKDARYAVRVANRDVPWWTDAGNKYGVNLLGTTIVKPGR